MNTHVEKIISEVRDSMSLCRQCNQELMKYDYAMKNNIDITVEFSFDNDFVHLVKVASRSPQGVKMFGLIEQMFKHSMEMAAMHKQFIRDEEDKMCFNEVAYAVELMKVEGWA